LTAARSWRSGCWAMPGAIVAGGAVYVIGMFGVTVVGNVPMNDRLDAADAAS